MNSHCPLCGADFEPEPGFYFGAMFVSYALLVLLFTLIGVILYLFFKPSDDVYVVSVVLAALVSVPFTFRYSRVLFLYWFGGYRYEPPL